MILLLGGTAEGREAADMLAAQGFTLCLSVFGSAGIEALPAAPPYLVRQGALDSQGFAAFFATHPVQAVVDAGHPFAQDLHRVAREACRRAGVPYLRLAREQVPWTDGDGIIPVADYPTAVSRCLELPGNIFLTIGSRHAAPFIRAGQARGRRVIARILPEASSLAEVTAAGLGLEDILAAKGPFSREFNLAAFRHFAAGVVVAKEAGVGSGQEEKLQAAATLALPVVLIRRPKEDAAAVTTLAELLTRLAAIAVKLG